MNCGLKCIKILLFIFNLIFVILGLALIVVGSLAVHEVKTYSMFNTSFFTGAAIGIIVVGVLVFIAAFSGCCGAIKENRCLLLTFCVLLGVFMLIEFVIAIYVFVQKAEVEKKVIDIGLKAVREYENATSQNLKESLDLLQENFKCCGARNYTDFKDPGNLPKSCLKDSKKPASMSNIFSEGCATKIVNMVKKQLIGVGVTCLIIIFIEIIGIIFSACLANHKDRKHV